MTPRLPRTSPPAAEDTDAAEVLQEALDALARRRTPYWLGDAALTLRLLLDLRDQIEARLPRAVADARDQECTWAQISSILRTSSFAAWATYRHALPTPIPD
jgi:hypothetical protein